MENLSSFIINNSLKVVVRPNSSKNEILGYDDARKAVKIAVKAPAEDNKANIELIKFVSKQIGHKVKISSGLTSKEKLLKLV